MNQRLLSHFNRIERHHWWWQGRQKLLTFLFKKENPQKILDIGCGTGETIKFLKNYLPKAEIYGLDSSLVAIKFARSRKLNNIKKGSATKLPFKDNSFDLVLLLDVLEHIKDDQKALKEAKRVLKPSGSIIVTAPALPFIYSDHDKNQNHFRRYTKKELISLAQNTKLNLVFLSYFNFFLSFPIIIIRLVSKLPIFKFLSSYDSGLNYDLANKKGVNTILTSLFRFEINLLKWIKYPIGISLVAKFKK